MGKILDTLPEPVPGLAAERMRVGRSEITRVVEWLGPIRTVGELFPATPAQVWRDNASWLAPHFWDPGQWRLPGGDPDLGGARCGHDRAGRHRRRQRP